MPAPKGPILSGGAALVAFTCPGSDPGLFRVDADGAVEALHRLSQRQRVGTPFEHRGGVVAPVEALQIAQVDGFIVAG